MIIKYFPFAPSGSTLIGNLASSGREMQSKSMYSFSKSQGLPRGKGQDRAWWGMWSGSPNSSPRETFHCLEVHCLNPSIKSSVLKQNEGWNIRPLIFHYFIFTVPLPSNFFFKIRHCAEAWNAKVNMNWAYSPSKSSPYHGWNRHIIKWLWNN